MAKTTALCSLGPKFADYPVNTSAIWAAALKYTNPSGFSFRSIPPSVLSVDPYRPDMKELMVPGANSLSTCRPGDILGSVRSYFLESVDVHQHAAIATGIDQSLTLSDFNRVFVVSRHLPRALLAQTHLAFCQAETQIRTIPHKVFTPIRSLNEGRIILADFVTTLFTVCGLLLILAKKRPLKGRGSSLLAFFTALEVATPAAYYLGPPTVESSWWSLISLIISAPPFDRYEPDQEIGDEFSTEMFPNSDLFDTFLTSRTSVTSCSPVVGISNSLSVFVIDPASIPLPEDEVETDGRDEGEQTEFDDDDYLIAFGNLIDPTNVPLPEDDDDRITEADQKQLSSSVEITEDSGLKENMLKEFESLSQEFSHQTESGKVSTMDEPPSGDDLNVSCRPSPLAENTTLTTQMNADSTASVRPEILSMEHETTVQDALKELDGKTHDHEPPMAHSTFHGLNNPCPGPMPATTTLTVGASSAGCHELSFDLDTSTLEDFVLESNYDREDTNGAETDYGHDANHEEQAAILMDIPQAEISRSDSALTARAHLVPSVSCPAALSGFVPLVRPASPPTQPSLTSSKSCPGLIPLSSTLVPGLYQCQFIHSPGIVGSQTCPSLSLEAGDPCEPNEEACGSEDLMIPTSRSAPEIIKIEESLHDGAASWSKVHGYGAQGERVVAKPTPKPLSNRGATSETPTSECPTCGHTSYKISTTGPASSSKTSGQAIDQDTNTSPDRILENELNNGPEGRPSNEEESDLEDGPSDPRLPNPCDRSLKQKNKSPSTYRMFIKMCKRMIAKYEGYIEDVEAGRQIQNKRDRNRPLEWFKRKLEQKRGEMQDAMEELARKEGKAVEMQAREAIKKAESHKEVGH
ncbi:hypothetical protein RhiJN_10011 [Ceratobasidium sp. AG-Ba]|nr:hypothetical protein RhiJN_10011 [Ceratobasidium sp. AG-Ba]QRW10779.1 hypothetical protein RhiLY_09778 [Ceratobasidium sp. AG-Ba]